MLRNAAFLGLAFFVVAAGLLYTAITAFLNWREMKRQQFRTELYTGEQQVVANYQTALDHFKRQQISQDQFIDALHTHVLAPWRELQAAERKLRDRESSPEVSALLDRRLEAMKLREQAWGLVIDSLREESEEGMENASRKSAEADQIDAEIAEELSAKAKKNEERADERDGNKL